MNVVFLVLDSAFNNHVSIQLSCSITRPALHYIGCLWRYFTTHSLLVFNIKSILVNVSAIPLVPLHIFCVVELSLYHFSMDSSCFWSSHMVMNLLLWPSLIPMNKHIYLHFFVALFISKSVNLYCFILSQVALSFPRAWYSMGTCLVRYINLFLSIIIFSNIRSNVIDICYLQVLWFGFVSHPLLRSIFPTYKSKRILIIKDVPPCLLEVLL